MQPEGYIRTGKWINNHGIQTYLVFWSLWSVSSSPAALLGHAHFSVYQLFSLGVDMGLSALCTKPVVKVGKPWWKNGISSPGPGGGLVMDCPLAETTSERVTGMADPRMSVGSLLLQLPARLCLAWALLPCRLCGTNASCSGSLSAAARCPQQHASPLPASARLTLESPAAVPQPWALPAAVGTSSATDVCPRGSSAAAVGLASFPCGGT